MFAKIAEKIAVYFRNAGSKLQDDLMEEGIEVKDGFIDELYDISDKFTPRLGPTPNGTPPRLPISKPKRILAIDGGGIRGILPALFLRAFEEYSDRRIWDLFDLVVGTSTGGLIALAATSKREITANKILDLYLKHAKQIFDSPRSRYLRPFWGPKYTGNGLRVLGKELFGDGRLSESKVPTAVTAYEIAERRPYVLKSWRAKESPKRDCLLLEAAMATAAAPTYFPAVRIGERTLVDGGVYANNPGAIALVESKLLWPNEDEILVSLGTGVSKIGYPKANSWGLLNWIGPLIDCVFDGSSDSIDYILKALLGSGFGLRLLNDASDIPTSGKNLIIVAAVNNVLHFRIFNGDGMKVVDTDGKRLTEQQAQQIEDLRKKHRRACGLPTR